MPASNTANSHSLSWKYRQASANRASKFPNCSPRRREISAIAASIRSFSRARSSSPMAAPSTWNRSLKRYRCGEVNNPVRRPWARTMPAQNAAVLPLPLDPVTTTEMRASLARSTATASSRSASRARQRPSPYFDRLNTQQSHRRKRVVPDFQDQVAAAGFFKQPDRGIGVDLDYPYRFGISG